MKFSDIIKMSVKNIRANSLKTTLTIISIAIGVASVMLIVSMSMSGIKAVTSELNKIGINGLTVYSKDVQSNPLIYEDIEYIQKKIPEITCVSPITVDYGDYRVKNELGNAVIMGIDENIDQVMNFTILYGRLPGETDIRFGRKVAVIDSELAQNLYKRDNITGKRIILSVENQSDTFEIIGVVSAQKDGINRISGGIIPDFIYVPYTALNCESTQVISQIAIKADNLTKTGEKAVIALNKKHNLKDGYAMENLSDHIENFKGITGFIGILLSAIAGISMCVSGIGIMNMMLANVTERKKEIGICMAIGATRKDVVKCFITEAALISAFGGLIGAAGGILFAIAIMSLLKIPIFFSVLMIVAIELISVFIGIMFSLLPAVRAAKLDPIDALREE